MSIFAQPAKLPDEPPPVHEKWRIIWFKLIYKKTWTCFDDAGSAVEVTFQRSAPGAEPMLFQQIVVSTELQRYTATRTGGVKKTFPGPAEKQRGQRLKHTPFSYLAGQEKSVPFAASGADQPRSFLPALLKIAIRMRKQCISGATVRIPLNQHEHPLDRASCIGDEICRQEPGKRV
jgi:hypothetical protein